MLVLTIAIVVIRLHNHNSLYTRNLGQNLMNITIFRIIVVFDNFYIKTQKSGN